MDHELIITILLLLLGLHHVGDIGVPLAKGIINSCFELVEYVVDRFVTFHERWQAAKARWRAAG